MSLGTGEALISFINENGEPNVVEKATILPPQSSIGAIDDNIRQSIINNSRFKGKYDDLIDRESTFEKIMAEIHSQEELESNQNSSNQSNSQNNNKPNPKGNNKSNNSSKNTNKQKKVRS